MGKQNQAITTYTNWKIVINAAEDMKIVSKRLWRVVNCRYIAVITREQGLGFAKDLKNPLYKSPIS